MCEIDVSFILSPFVLPKTMSASASELGPDAGKITWANCLDVAECAPSMLVTDENRDDVRDHFAAYGAWKREEINAWTDRELSALIWQEVAADMRYFTEHCKGSLAKYEEDCHQGRISGRLMIEGLYDILPTKAIFYVGV